MKEIHVILKMLGIGCFVVGLLVLIGALTIKGWRNREIDMTLACCCFAMSIGSLLMLHG